VLRARGDLHLALPSMRAVGYRQVWEFLDGAHTYEVMVELAVTATRGLAKRQMTWLRSERDVCDITHSFDHADGVARLVTAVETWLNGASFTL